MLSVEDLQVHYQTPRGAVKAVNGVSFALRPGERLGLIGESGSGKTTMGTALMRLTRPPGRIVGGRIVLNGRDLLSVPERELRRIRMREIALVPQGAMSSLNPVMRIREQILDGIVAHEGNLPRAELNDRTSGALGRVGLPATLADRFPHELSGGQKQRVAIAIATVLSPSVIVADEPTSALDVVVQRQVIMTLGRVQEGLGAAVILIGHDMGLIAQFADTIGVLYAGELVEYGPIDDVLDDPRHPYTRLLVESLPSLEARRELRGIPGLPPALLDLPPGCPFAPRCPHAFERCPIETARLLEVGPARRVACHLYDEPGVGRA
ncbi:MAG: ABC transporter ATP-binding protein [Chloroflexi bacterium]|nr:ABC transporter ATP-binding protein [Chloroflexota bacterium]